MAIVLGVALLGAGTTAARPTTPALLAAPAPEPPRLLFREDFEAVSGGSWQSLTSYPGAGGAGYAATTYWSAPEMCNGLVTLHAPPSPASPCPHHTDVGVASERLPQAHGAPASTGNHALAWYSYDPDAAHPMAPGDVLLRTVGGIPVPAGGRFLRVAFDGAGMQCPNPAPLLTLAIDESGTERDPWAAPVELCTDPRSVDVGASAYGRVRVGRYESESAVRVLSTSVELVVRNGDPGTPGHYNDGGIDELRLLDVTPALHVEYVEAGPVTTGQTATLRFVVVNSTDLLAKDGWGFRDDLPAGLSVAGPATTTCPATTVTAPSGGSAVQVDTGRLDAGLASCEVRVPVTTQQAGTYAAGAVQRTALDASGTASVQFVAPAPPPPSPPPATAGPVVVPSSGGTSLPKSSPGATSAATGDATGDTATSIGADPTTAVDPTDSIDSGSADPSADATAATDDPPAAASGPDGGAPEARGDRPAPAGSDSEPYSPGYDVDRARPEAPSVLTEQLPSILDVVRDPALMASALAGGLVWTLGLVVTTGTLNRALKTRYDRIAALAGRLGARPLLARIAHVLGSGHWLVIVGLLAVNATVLAFVDPHLGMNASSVRLVVSIAT
ncbi:hypothetical protein, partial [Nocardioides albidus]|uniref:DUF7933 domain-containing protein n=1 Tax=Nocardioides albidus TaxID=1517589 RepID=UPI0013054887